MRIVKKLFLFILTMVLAGSCAKIQRVIINLSPETVISPPEGGDFIVVSECSDFELEPVIYVLEGDAKQWGCVECQVEYAHPEIFSGIIGIEWDWVKVKEISLDSNAALKITVSKNVSGKPRSCRIIVMAGDSMDSVTVKQNSN